MATIASLMPGVKAKLANRADVDNRSPFWLRDSIRELTVNTQFEELKDTGPEIQLTVNEGRYLITDFTLGKEDFSDINFFEIFVDYPTNSVTGLILFREAAVLGPLHRYPGLPKFFTRHGKYFLLGPRPFQPFTVRMSYQKRHPFPDESLSGLKATEVMMPEDWVLILETFGAMLGALELRLPDYYDLYHRALFGDPKKPTELGLLRGHETQHFRDKSRNAGQMTPIVRPI